MNNAANSRSRNVIETVLLVFLLLALLVALYEVLRLFFGVLTFALVFAISFEGVYEWLVKHLNNKRKLAGFLYAFLLILIIALPLIFIFSSLTKNIKPVIDWVNDVKVNGLPVLPQSVANIPLIGKEIAKLWSQYHDDPKQIISDHQEQVQAISKQAMTSGISLLATMLDIIIGIIISAILLVRKTDIVGGILMPLERLLGSRSGKTLLLAINMAIKGVSIGVMGTALIAAIIAFIGFAIAGVPLSLILAVVVFLLVVLQIGPLPVWIPVIIWMSTQDHPGRVVFLIIWGVVLTVIDYIIKPILIAKSGGKLPFLVLFLGVIGGLAAWGFTGMFKGAIILAVFYTVYNSWLKNASVNTAPLTA